MLAVHTNQASQVKSGDSSLAKDQVKSQYQITEISVVLIFTIFCSLLLGVNRSSEYVTIGILNILMSPIYNRAEILEIVLNYML